MNTTASYTAESNAVIITGGGGGIGAATARKLSADGARIIVIDRDLEMAEACVNTLSGSGHYAAGVDVVNPDAVQALIRSLPDRGYRVTGVVNCAGTITRSAAENFDLEAWRKEIDIHLTGSMLIAQAAHHQLSSEPGRSAIVNIASVGAILGLHGRLAYTTAKAGILGLTRTLASEWGRQGIRVNAVAPGYVLTPMVESGLKNGTLEQSALTARIPLGRLARPEEISSVIAFLLSAEASYINGATLCADGGLTVDGKFD